MSSLLHIKLHSNVRTFGTQGTLNKKIYEACQPYQDSFFCKYTLTMHNIVLLHITDIFLYIFFHLPSDFYMCKASLVLHAALKVYTKVYTNIKWWKFLVVLKVLCGRKLHKQLWMFFNHRIEFLIYMNEGLYVICYHS